MNLLIVTFRKALLMSFICNSFSIQLKFMAEPHSPGLHYGKILIIGVVVFFLIQIISSALESLLISDSTASMLLLKLTVSILVPILIGVWLINTQRENLGWGLISGSGLIILYWLGSFLLFSAL